MKRLILVRHGQSQWNLENRFTGWEDIPLTKKGQDQAKKAGKLLKKYNFQFGVAHTSYLQRAIHTLWFVLSECEQSWIPVIKNWRLNERHYGDLQGLDKREIQEKYGRDRVFNWRRGYDTLPPLVLGKQDHLLKDCRYENVEIPKGESLKQTLERVIPYWNEVILPGISNYSRSVGRQTGKTKKTSIDTLIVAHGNSLRALVKYLTNMDEQKIMDFEFMTGVPLVCELDNNNRIGDMNWISHVD